MCHVLSNKFGDVAVTIDTKVSKESQEQVFKNLSNWEDKSLFVLNCETPPPNLELIYTSPIHGQIYGNRLASELILRARDGGDLSSFVCLFFLKDGKGGGSWMVQVQGWVTH